MPPQAHARLSPSASERWIECPASIRMEAQVPKPPESSYATEGTAAHALAEIKASLAFDIINNRQAAHRRVAWRKKFSIEPEVEAEMDVHTDAYVELVKERAARYPHTQVMFEQRLNTGVPTCWGTSDTVLVSPVHVEIIDFKYGAGVAVDAEGNPQLRLYALGALDTYGDVLGETEMAFSTVFQPRMDNHVLTEEITPAALRAWRESILPIAALALGEDAFFGPSETACRWCPASGRCRAQLEDVFQDDAFTAPPETLTPQEVADTLGRVKSVRIWLEAFEASALDMAYSEHKEIPGYKVVMSGGRRYVANEEKALDALLETGLTPMEVGKFKLKGIGDLEKLLGKDDFSGVLGPYVQKTEGKPSLVPESDRRNATSPTAGAQGDFGVLS